MKHCILSAAVASSIFFAAVGSVDVSAFSVSDVSAKAAVIIDACSGNVIAGKNEDMTLPMASTTKIMSSLLLIESGDLDSKFKVDNDAIMVEGSSMGLRKDDIVTKRDLCYGMLLPSGNDAANETAVLLAGSPEKFAVMMNEKARDIGLKNTHFVTPSGLHDEDHYSTAYDMAMLTREALRNDTFREICGTKQIKLCFGDPPYERWLTNTNNLLSLYDGCIGVKTGFTDEAGRCLVSAAQRNGVTLICVTLNASDDWNDHMKMYEYGFSVTKSRKAVCDLSGMYVNVAGGSADKVHIEPAEIPEYTIINGSEPTISYKAEIENFIYAPVEKGRKAGEIRFYADEELIGISDLISSENCEAVIKEYEPSIFEILVERIKRSL